VLLAALVIGGVQAMQPMARAQTESPTTWAVTIILPPRVVAGGPAMLAVLGIDGKLAPGITVELTRDLRVTTDPTGRAFFTVPAGTGYLIAKASGSSAAALIDNWPVGKGAEPMSVLAFVSVKDRFAICGGPFRGDADANHISLDDAPALILAASPECLIALPAPQSAPGPAKILVDAPDLQWTGTTTLVSLAFEPPNPPLMVEKKSRLAVDVRGTDQALGIVVENESPNVLRFQHGDVQRLRTSGGTPNLAAIEVATVRSGDFSFRAHLIAAPDLPAARRYLDAAAAAAPEDIKSYVEDLSKKLAKHPGDASKVAQATDKILNASMVGDFRTLLAAARAAL
jgi:hypothetical protein